ncbi:MAG: 2-oxoacid:acceptor oxidoreductase family protein [Candidatus Schekmanbacteria bacterium]|nr:2-oxoacid:acceptor oxidoreductase family protein [Candidatus Schekmanbacteria bacterium]
MKTATEVRWHGRGGQGTVTAAKVLAETALSSGKYVQAFPEYGPERMGAPLRAYNRVSSAPISIHCQVTNPDIVVVVDSTLLQTVNVLEGTNEDVILVVNTPESPQAIKEQLTLDKQRVFTVNASKIALENIGKPMPNTPMLGALAKVSGLISLDDLLKDVKKSFGKKFAENVINNNLNAVRQAYEQVNAA